MRVWFVSVCCFFRELLRVVLEPLANKWLFIDVKGVQQTDATVAAIGIARVLVH